MLRKVFPILIVLSLLAGFGDPPALQAQATSMSRAVPVAVQIEVRSQARSARWASSAPVVYCAPAPLTERPEAAADYRRPRVAPLEESLLDAHLAKRSLAMRLPAQLGEHRIR